jgi:hypothetical protein
MLWKKMTKQFAACAMACAVGVGMTGCETYGQGAGLGAGVGAAAGAIIGHQSGHALEGAAIGAALGGLTGLVAHDIKARKQREAAETAQEYNYEPAQGEMLRYEGAEVIPNAARPDEMIQSSVTYALLGAGAGVQVQEARVLMRGSEQIAELSNQSFTRTDGTWRSTQDFRLPNNLTRGNYTIETRVRTAKSSVSGRANFYVD